jgi:predicted site-specific integrase-resolvase
MHQNDLISAREAAIILSINRATVHRWIEQGLVPVAVKAPGIRGARMFHRADIEALAAKRAA